MLIVAQRQTALVAKQAACLDVLSGGRFRLGIGVGWNPVEFTGLNENFHNRGRRSEEQVQVMQALWAQPHVTFKGKYHTIEDAGINPRPASGRIPLWYGGHHEHTLPRIAKWGDGWMPNAYPPDQSALDIFADLRRLTEQAGRDPAPIGIEVWTSCGQGTEAGLAARGGVLEAGRGQPYLPDHHLQPPPPHPHCRHNDSGSSGRDEALPRRHRGHSLEGTPIISFRQAMADLP